MQSYAGVAARSAPELYNYQPDQSYEELIESVVRRDDQSIDYVSKYHFGETKQHELIEALVAQGTPVSRMLTVLKLKDGHFSVRFNKNDKIVDTLPSILDVGENTFVKESAKNFECKLYSNSRYVKLFNFPGECELEWLRPVFAKFGTVKKIYRNYLKEYPTVENGTVTIVMNKEAVVSKIVWVKGNRFKTWYAGQEDELRVKARCFRCNAIGHYRYECLAQITPLDNVGEEDSEGRPESGQATGQNEGMNEEVTGGDPTGSNGDDVVESVRTLENVVSSGNSDPKDDGESMQTEGPEPPSGPVGGLDPIGIQDEGLQPESEQEVVTKEADLSLPLVIDEFRAPAEAKKPPGTVKKLVARLNDKHEKGSDRKVERGSKKLGGKEAGLKGNDPTKRKASKSPEISPSNENPKLKSSKVESRVSRGDVGHKAKPPVTKVDVIPKARLPKKPPNHG